MAHQITQWDGMFSVREVPWHGLGIVLDEPPVGVKEALAAAGLGWYVEQEPVYVKQLITDPTSDYPREIFVPLKDAGDVEYRANIRSDNRAVLGVVTDDYKVVQNLEAFEFMDALLASDVAWETAGSLQGGKRVWVLARRPDHVEIGGDETVPYLYVANSHDGSMAVQAAATTVRIVCANTLGAALRQSEHGEQAQRTFRFRHTGNLTAKFEEARKVIGMTIKWEQAFKELGDRLALEPITVDAFDKRVLSKMFTIDADTMGKRAIANRERSKEQIIDIFRGKGPQGDTSGNSPGTKWMAYNAITEYADFCRRYTKKSNQVQRSFEDFDMKERGLSLVVAA